jgi:hypothetical protein
MLMLIKLWDEPESSRAATSDGDVDLDGLELASKNVGDGVEGDARRVVDAEERRALDLLVDQLLGIVSGHFNDE